MTYKLMLLLPLILLVSCKSHEYLITPADLCEDLKDEQEPGDIRSEYQRCLDNQRTQLTSRDFCSELCLETCTEDNLTLGNSWTDFSGCHCRCNVKVDFFS